MVRDLVQQLRSMGHRKDATGKVAHAGADEIEHLRGEVDRLARFLMDNCDEPSRDEGAVDTAIRLLTAYAERSGG